MKEHTGHEQRKFRVMTRCLWNLSLKNLISSLGHSQVRRGLARWPAVTNALTYGTLFCTAELTQQLLIKKYLPYKEVRESRIVDKNN